MNLGSAQRALTLDVLIGRAVWSLAALLGLAIVSQARGALYGRPGGEHKSEAELARLEPAQRVEEACKEYARHEYSDGEYWDLIRKYVGGDGLNAVPQLVKIMDEYNPADPKARGRSRSGRCEAASGLLEHLDQNVVRLRASAAGRNGVEAMRRLVDRMRAAHFDAATGDEYERQLRYEASVVVLTQMEGINSCDEAVCDTLRLRYRISLSNQETLDFVNYLVAQDPSYPGWSERDLYKDLERRNDAGNPLQYVIVTNIEPFHKLYLQYKARTKS